MTFIKGLFYIIEKLFSYLTRFLKFFIKIISFVFGITFLFFLLKKTKKKIDPELDF